MKYRLLFLLLDGIPILQYCESALVEPVGPTVPLDNYQSKRVSRGKLETAPCCPMKDYLIDPKEIQATLTKEIFLNLTAHKFSAT